MWWGGARAIPYSGNGNVLSSDVAGGRRDGDARACGDIHSHADIDDTTSIDREANCKRRAILPDLFSGGPGSGASGGEVDVASVEDVLARGLRLAEASPVHLAFRGTAAANSVRCEWRGVARTPEQREAAVRFWLDLDDDDPLPSPAEAEARFISELDRINAVYPATLMSNFSALARGGPTTGYTFLTCYADYTVQEYLLGSGDTGMSNQLGVAYDRMGESHSYKLYKLAHQAGEFGSESLMSEGEYADWRKQLVSDIETVLGIILEGRESVLFLAPMGAHNAIAFEAWQAVA